ncbi:MAG: RHS repeat domain-containing protein, partial [Planctomycetota bacterium]
MIVARPGADPHRSEDGFEVTLGGPNLETRLIVPRRLGRNWPATIWIEYTNTGDASMPVPLLKLDATDDAILSINASLAGRSFARSPLLPSGAGDTVQFMPVGSGATPGILQPGDSARVPVYFHGLERSSWNFSDNRINFSLGFLPVGQPDLIDWAAMKDDLRPESIAADAWDAIWENFAGQVGNTWGDYSAMLGENMNYLQSVGQEVSYQTGTGQDAGYRRSLISTPQVPDVGKLLAFELQQAFAAWPHATLAGEVDAYSPAPGMPLVFSRVYGQSIESRYELGPLGRGWRHNWDVYAEELSDGDVIIRGPGGTDRYFTSRGGGSFTASPGDYGTLTFANNKYRLTEKHGTVWQFRTDDRLDYVEDTNGIRITAGYDAGRLTRLTHSGGDQLLIDYNADGRIWHVTDSRGEGPDDDYVTTFEYDDVSGQYLQTVTAPGDPPRVTSYAYETMGTPQQTHALLSIEYPDAAHDYFHYDEHGRLDETHRDGGAESVTYDYDSAGTVTITDATDRQTVLYFGVGGQLVQARDGEGNVLNLGYDGNYQLAGLAGPSNQQYRYSYDSQGNVTGIEDPVRNTTAFAYEPSLNNLASVTDARDHGMDYDYDDYGNLRSITYEDGTIESFTYYRDDLDGQPDGSVETWTNRRGDTVTYTYWPNGQLKTKDYSTTPEIDYQYVYDDADNLRSATGPEGTTSMDYYAETDWLRRIDYPGGRFFQFDYWPSGMRKTRTDQDGNVVNYLPDALGRLDTMTDGTGALIVDYDYDPAGRMERKTLGNGVYTTYQYDNAGQLTHLINYAPDDTLLSRFDYTYDASGRRDSMTVTRNPATDFDSKYDYGYDPLGQLTSVTYPDGHVVSYEYDAVGNRIQVNDDGTPTDYATNEMNQYEQVGGTAYQYDDDGNLISKTENGITTTYTYNIENRLIGVSTPTDTWAYTYDALGNRVSSTHNGVTTNYLIDPIGLANVAAEYDDTGALVGRYDHGLGLLARTDAAETPGYYTFDAIGSTSELTDPAGAILNSYAYDPFGISLYKDEPTPNPFEYVGELGVMNETNDMQFMRARFYDFGLGRFIQDDPIGLLAGDTNLYRYAWNQPTAWADPTGMYSGELPDVFGGLKRRKEYYNKVIKGTVKPGDYNRHNLDAERTSKLADKAAVEGFSSYLWDLVYGVFGNWGDIVKGFFDITGGLFRLLVRHWSHSIPNPLTQPAGDGSSRIPRVVDPNDKIAPGGYGEANFVRENDLLPYTIRFENMPKATAPAHLVTITDTLDEDLDLSTFELTEIGFADQTMVVPEGLNHYETTIDLVVDNDFLTQPAELRVQIEVGLDPVTRELTFDMIGLDPLTGWLPEDIMLGILYPNDDTGRGEGYVSYIVKPKSGLPSGTEITNRATIVFDWNDPIDTPLVLNTIDAGTPESHVLPLPEVTTATTFEVRWTGEDEPGGSGIASYDVCYRVDNGEDVPWLENTTDTSAMFTGEYGHTYAFYSVATDNVGHREAVPALHDAHTRLQPARTAHLAATIREADTPPPDDSRWEVEALPESVRWIDEWDSFWVEIWGSTPYADDAGITDFSVDVTYNTDYFTTTSVEYNLEFTGSQPNFDDAAGLVDGIRATTSRNDLGDDKHVLLARVLLEPTDSDPGVPHNAVSRYITPVFDLGVDLEDAQVELNQQGTAMVQIRHPANPEVWPVMYDVDDDRRVGFGDLAYFAEAFQQTVGDPGAQFAYSCDFDCSDRVGFGDLAFFAENFQKGPGDVIVYPADFPDRWRTEDLVLREVAGKAMSFLRAVIDPVSGLPYNEATQAELDSGTGQFTASHFVPAQLGNWLTAAVLSNALARQLHSGVSTGYTDEELIDQLEITIESLEGILADHAFTDDQDAQATGAKALYQAHDTHDGTLRDDDFGRKVSLLDNVQLIAGLEVAKDYLRRLTPDLNGALAARAETLAGKIDAALGEFDVGMWLDGGTLWLGDQNDPRAGTMVDRITSESRLAPVVALARGEITAEEFAAIVDATIRQSQSATTPGGVAVAQVPFDGNALQIWAVTPCLSRELSTFYGPQTLEPLAATWLEKSQALGLPAAGATDVADGFGQFGKFGLSPAEGQPQYLDASVLIPPAAGMMAGALGASAAIENLASTVDSLRHAGFLDPTYGMPNYQDFGSGLVNMDNPVYGTLEIAQMTVGLLNQLLGGSFVEDLLRETTGWSDAVGEYAALLNVREAEFRPDGDGYPIARTNAVGETIWHLNESETEVSYEILVGAGGYHELRVRY